MRQDDPQDLLARFGKICLRCQHEWLPRVREPKRCPRCRSTHWATPRTNRQGMRPITWAEKLAILEGEQSVKRS